MNMFEVYILDIPYCGMVKLGLTRGSHNPVFAGSNPASATTSNAVDTHRDEIGFSCPGSR